LITFVEIRINSKQKMTKLTTATLLPASLIISFSSCTNRSESKMEPSDGPPNVLFIAVDDLRDWTGYLTGFSDVKTPNLDALANSGIVFSSAYCSAPVCSPSRTSLLSGISPSKNGVYENGNLWQGDLRKHITLTRYFMDNGYYAAGFGKIYHGQGDLQYWHNYEYGEYSPEPDNPDNPMAFGNPLDIPDSLTGDWKRVTNAISILNRDIASPLFLACGLVRPHTPWDVPREYFELYPLDSIELPEVFPGDLNDIPPIGRAIAGRKHRDNYGEYRAEWTHQSIQDSGLWKINIQAYLASISYADAQIGRLLQAWNDSPYSDNGIVVLWGDHGWHLGEKEHWSKRTLWEEGTRTPLIFASKGKISEGLRCSTPVSLLDIFPTLIDFCGLPVRDNLDGLSILPLINSPDLPWDRPAVTIWGQNNVSVRSADWRYIHYCDGTKELYDHRNDPGEHENLASDPAMIKIINAHHRWVPDCIPPSRAKRELWFKKEGLMCED